MDKNLKRHIGNVTVDSGYLGGRQLAGQHDTAEALMLQPAHLGRRAIVGLGRSVQGYRGEIHFQDAHVLNENGIGSCLIELMDELLHSRQLVIVDNRVDGDVDFCREEVGIVA